MTGMSEYEDIDKEEAKRREKWMVKWYGPRCCTFNHCCIVCQLWQLHDAFVALTQGCGD